MDELKQQLEVIDQAVQKAHSIIEVAGDEAQLAQDKSAIANVLKQASELDDLLDNWKCNTDQLFTDIDDKGATFDAWNDENDNEESES